MMVVDRRAGTIRHELFRNLGKFLQAGDLLVLNNTKVIPARIWSKNPAIELLLVEQTGPQRWTALVKPGKRAKPGTVLHFEDGALTATVEGSTDFGGRILQFTGDVDRYLEKFGAAPLPPYIKHPGRDPADLARYQTIFAKVTGAIAAPTAGLHFTPATLDELRRQGVGHAFITLHVGIGTFRPVKVENLEEHKMHAEKFSVSPETAAALQTARRVVAVGTTVVRTLEAVGQPRPAQGTTDIFIHPPFQFRMTGALLTNFHLPRSTLLMLVSAFASRELILRAYEEAVGERYRFFSYGDCMLIL